MPRGRHALAVTAVSALLLSACGEPRDSHGHMVRSLLDLARAESLYYGLHGTYTGAPEALRLNGRPFEPAGDVRLIISRADHRGWHAVTSNMATDEVCRLTRSAPGTVPADTSLPDCR